MHVQRLVGRDRPRRRGPDHREAGLVAAAPAGRTRVASLRSRLGEREADVDREVLAVLVLDLGLGQRRAAVEAPVDRLQAAVDEAPLEQRAERADLVGLVREVHRRVRMVPVAEHAEALEVAPSAARSARWRRRGASALRLVAAAGCLPCVFSICTSIGMPWQSQPGTYGASKPASVAALDDRCPSGSC